MTSLKDRYAADKAKHFEQDHDKEKRLSEVALRTEQKWNVLAAELKVLERKQAMQAAENSNQKDQKKKAAAIEKAKKELASAEESLKKLNTDPNAPIKQYTPVTKAYPSESSGRRLALARWITHPQNPLTARVAVNHIWTRHFGTPLVENVFDLGMKSPKPELLSLLDWLASELIENGWDMKHLHRLIVASEAYKRASSGTPEQIAFERAKDADNRFYWRFPTRRLDAEEVRDNLLSVSHLLDASMGGPDLSEDDGEKSYRRSVYFRHAYEKQMTMLVLFDAASPSECYRRKPSIIPQQALVIANSPLARSASRSLGSRLWKDAKQDAVLFVERLFLEVLGRPASQWERNKSMDYLEQYQQGNLSDSPLPIESNAASRNEKMPDATPVDRWEKACQSLAHVLINHNDFVNIR